MKRDPPASSEPMAETLWSRNLAGMPPFARLLRMAIAFVYLAGMASGLLFVVVLPFEMYQKSQAESWPSRKGVITRSVATLENQWDVAVFGSVDWWTADICGTYLESGEEFCIRRVTLGLHAGSQTKAYARKTVARYPVARVVDVYYSPGKPMMTILEPYSSWDEMYIAVGISIAFLLSPVFLHFRRRNAVEPKEKGAA